MKNVRRDIFDASKAHPQGEHHGRCESHQAGFTLMSAVFILVVLTLIGTFIVSIASMARTSDTLGMQGTRAYYAAKSGLEWGIFKVAPSNGSPPYNCPTSPTTLTFSQGAMTGFTTTVTCTQNQFSEAGVNYNMFQIISFAEYGTVNSLDYVSRKLYVTVIQPGV